MPFTFACSKCGKAFRGNEQIAGKQMKCPKCGTLLRIPAPPTIRDKASSPPSRVSAGPAKHSERRTANITDTPAPATAVRVTCPHCKSPCRIQPAWLGRSIQCPSCQKLFNAPSTGTKPPVARPLPAPAPDFIPDDEAFESVPVVVDDDSSSVYDMVEEQAETPYRPPQVPTRSRSQPTKPGGAFGEWVRGPGLWILDGVCVPLFVVMVLLKMPSRPSGSGGAFLVGYAVGMICGLVIFLPLALAVGALLLRLACKICRIASPPFMRCMGIVMVIVVLNAVVNLLFEWVVDTGDPTNPNVGATITLMVLSLGTWAAISIPVLMITLETSVGRAALVSLIEFVLIIALVIVLGIIIVVIALALGLSLGLGGAGSSGPPQMMPDPGQQFPGNPFGPGQPFPDVPGAPGTPFPGAPQGSP